MMNSGSPMSYENLAALLESMGPLACARFMSDREVECALKRAEENVDYDNTWHGLEDATWRMMQESYCVHLEITENSRT